MSDRSHLKGTSPEVIVSSDKGVLVIQSGISAKSYYRDLWRHRELLLFLAWRDILVRYKQTVIGLSWVLIRPLLTMIILTAVFGRVANLQSGEIPYAILVFSGLLPWFFFSNALSDCSNSLVINGPLLSKVYFPRLIVPASTILVSAVDFGISIILLLLLMLWYSIAPCWQLLLLPILGLWVGALSYGLGLWFSALTVRYRDFRHIVPFLLQLGIYASPVGYNANMIPEKWKYFYYLNPIAGVIEAFRWSIIGLRPSIYGIAIAFVMTAILLVTGLMYFLYKESSFADEI